MSHFTTLVMLDSNTIPDLTDTSAINTAVDNALAPYYEEYDIDGEYAEFTEYDEGDISPDDTPDPITGKYGYWENPNAEWDWYVIGGRWDGGIPTKDGGVNVARVKDIDWEIKQEELEECVDFWDNYVEGKGEYKDFVYWKPSHYKKLYGDVNTYVKATCQFNTFAVIDLEGRWHARGEMMFFGIVNNEKNAEQWDLKYKEVFLDSVPEDTVVVLVDCHI